MGKVRILESQSVHFYKVIVILRNGEVKSGIDMNSIADIDTAWHSYEFRANEKFGGKIDSFQCMQMSTHDPEVKKYLRENNIKLPVSEPAPELKPVPGKVENFEKYKPSTPPTQGGKYRR